MSLTEFAQYAFIVFLYLVLISMLISFLFAATMVYVFRRNTTYQTVVARMELARLDEEWPGISDFDRHVATTPGMTDNTND